MEKLQDKASNLSEEEIDVEFDKLILAKTEFEETEPTELNYYKRRLYMREYLGDLRKVITVYVEVNKNME